MSTDAGFMRVALDLARRGRGWVNPNPMVGAVVVRNGEIVGKGYHPRAGEPHAEVFALQEAGERARGATLYVTLEPCDHHGRTPPCTDAILAAGISRVVVASRDPNPSTAASAEKLAATGVQVAFGVESADADLLNAPFFKYIRTGMPYVVCKMAMSLDGKIATTGGQSQWISGSAARQQVQEWRATFAAVMVGIGTVLADDPSLTCRLDDAHSPVRVVVDPLGQTPPSARLFEKPGRVVIGVGPEAPDEALAGLEARGAEIVRLPARAKKRAADGAPGEFMSCADSVGGLRAESVGRTGAEPTDGASESLIGSERYVMEGVMVADLLRSLSRGGISSILLEGGGGLNAAMLSEKLIDRVAFFIAPILIGGRNAPSPLEGEGFARLSEAVRLRSMRFRELGSDILIEGDLDFSES
jgi:diaminohydroxyphosphoribosylaminopyrimidine deaminase/5-amino-6-(5-phosphoribosylamino)uracil reductase